MNGSLRLSKPAGEKKRKEHVSNMAPQIDCDCDMTLDFDSGVFEFYNTHDSLNVKPRGSTCQSLNEDLVELCLSTESKEEVQLDIAANLNASGNKLFSQSSRRQLDTSNDQGTVSVCLHFVSSPEPSFISPNPSLSLSSVNPFLTPCPPHIYRKTYSYNPLLPKPCVHHYL
ncbi:Transcription factor lepE [Fusarium oxysporum f. sp. albedinis]|nr:Transcription factor lepE [Fusarium oxysporum f. sp. albedinis]